MVSNDTSLDRSDDYNRIRRESLKQAETVTPTDDKSKDTTDTSSTQSANKEASSQFAYGRPGTSDLAGAALNGLNAYSKNGSLGLAALVGSNALKTLSALPGSIKAKEPENSEDGFATDPSSGGTIVDPKSMNDEVSRVEQSIFGDELASPTDKASPADKAISPFANEKVDALKEIKEADPKTKSLDKDSDFLGRANADQLKKAGIESGTVDQKNGSVYINDKGQMAYKYKVTEENKKTFESTGKEVKVGDEVEAVYVGKADGESGTGWKYADQATESKLDEHVKNEFNNFRKEIEGAEKAGMQLSYAGHDENSMKFKVGGGDFELTRNNETGEWSHAGEKIEKYQEVQDARVEALENQFESLKDIDKTALGDRATEIQNLAHAYFKDPSEASLSKIEALTSSLSQDYANGIAPAEANRVAELGVKLNASSEQFSKIDTAKIPAAKLTPALEAETSQLQADIAAQQSSLNELTKDGKPLTGFQADENEAEAAKLQTRVDALAKQVAALSTPEINPLLKELGLPAEGGVVKFGTWWCGPCQRMDVAIDGLKRSNPNLPVTSIDAEVRRDLAAQFNITGYPTSVLIGSNGQEIDRMSGALEANELMNLLNRR